MHIVSVWYLTIPLHGSHECTRTYLDSARHNIWMRDDLNSACRIHESPPPTGYVSTSFQPLAELQHMHNTLWIMTVFAHTLSILKTTPANERALWSCAGLVRLKHSESYSNEAVLRSLYRHP
ncbi:hypothetical protein QCA50_020584 [Cerrena zonata]|uniref:Uncharacterized protein n=1 Tax=Cerrena zonata TaxID=2478898 RepID=A0AAW0FE95_9APHY